MTRWQRNPELLRRAPWLALLALLAACSSSPPRPEPPRQPHAEPVPRAEPLSRYGNHSPYRVLGHTYRVLATSEGYRERGIASWYGPNFHGKPTSNQETFDMYQFTAAHRTLPLPSYARVTNLSNGRSVVVRINDRGPFARGRIIDLSFAAAEKIDMIGAGTAEVEVVALSSGGAQRPPVASARNVFLQVGAFTEKNNAMSLVQRLRRRNVGRTEIQSVRESRGTIHRVRIGPLADADSAESLADQLSSWGFERPRLIFD